MKFCGMATFARATRERRDCLLERVFVVVIHENVLPRPKPVVPPSWCEVRSTTELTAKFLACSERQQVGGL